jgi:hypothetical protein
LGFWDWDLGLEFLGTAKPARKGKEKKKVILEMRDDPKYCLI